MLNPFLNSLKSVAVRSSYFPPILDYDPVLAANFLTIKDSETALSKIESSLVRLKEGTPKELLDHFLIWSEENLEWMSLFMLELIKLNGTSQELEKLEGIRTKGNEGLCFPPPFKGLNKRQVISKEKNIKVDVIDRYRIEYIYQEHQLDEFRGEYPAWYSFNSYDIFEKYNSKTNVRVKISFHNGEFCYYIAGASDKWRQIVGVPLEMDQVVSTILFRN